MASLAVDPAGALPFDDKDEEADRRAKRKAEKQRRRKNNTLAQYQERQRETAAGAAARTSAEEKRQSSTAADAKMETCPKLPHEDDEGNVEYKWKLVRPTEERLQQLITQLHFRLGEGGNEAIYEIGVEDDGTPRGLSDDDLDCSLQTLERMCKALECDSKVLRIREGADAGNKCAEVMIRRVYSSTGDAAGSTGSTLNSEKVEVRVAVIGNVDSGKSTLVGVLTKGQLDNGRGSSRSLVFRHRHEIESGRTSSVSQQVMGFSATGEITNYVKGISRPATQQEVVRNSSKMLTFIDLAGHEHYLKTTIFGMTGALPDYGMLMLGANMGVQRMTKEHLGIALALNLPFFLVVTKIDIAPAHILKQTMKKMRGILKSRNVGKLPFRVKNMGDVLSVVKSIHGGRVVPVFRVSNVTGEGLDLLKAFLNLLPGLRNVQSTRQTPAEFFVDDHFTVPGVGTVVAGTLYSGRISAGDELLLGPDFQGAWKRVLVKSIHCKQLPVRRIAAGQSGSFALKLLGDKSGNRVERSSLRKGMVLVAPELEPRAVKEFEAEVLILHHPTTIKENYQVSRRGLRLFSRLLYMFNL